MSHTGYIEVELKGAGTPMSSYQFKTAKELTDMGILPQKFCIMGITQNGVLIKKGKEFKTISLAEAIELPNLTDKIRDGLTSLL